MNSRVSDYWSTVDCGADERNFYAFPPIRARSCRMVFGEIDPRPDWCERLTAKVLRERLPFERCLSICCGFGHAERLLWDLGFAREIVGTDIAPGAVAEAERQVNGNLRYYVSDVNRDPLPTRAYDLIWANGALHHLAVESVVPKLRRALRPGGVLVCTEYVGPRYQQIDRARVALINEARTLLPAELKSRTVVYWPFGTSLAARAVRHARRQWDAALHRGPAWAPAPIGHYLATDPSECVSSDRVLPELAKHFTLDVRGFGGSIVFYALDSAFYRNFDGRNARHVDALQAVFDFEDAHLATLGHDNVHVICT